MGSTPAPMFRTLPSISETWMPLLWIDCGTNRLHWFAALLG
jgi:hypothetical protein